MFLTLVHLSTKTLIRTKNSISKGRPNEHGKVPNIATLIVVFTTLTVLTEDVVYSLGNKELQFKKYFLFKQPVRLKFA